MGLYFIIVVAMLYVLLDWSLVYLIIIKIGFVVCIMSVLIFIRFAKPKKTSWKGQLIKDLTRPILSFFSDIYYFIKSVYHAWWYSLDTFQF